jgi:hypothetical protein
VKGPYYLAGPMSNLPQFNFPAFHEAASALRARGYEVVSPAELDGIEIKQVAMASKKGKLDAAHKIAGHTWGDLLSRDVKVVADKVEGIILLPGWQNSRGARLECFVGLLCGHSFFAYKGRGKIARRSNRWIKERLL